jgi:GTP cyclohydrolase I
MRKLKVKEQKTVISPEVAQAWDSIQDLGTPASAAAYHIAEAMSALDLNPDAHPGTVRTPERFVKYLQEFMKPYKPEDILGPLFEGPKPSHGMPGIVVQKNIPFRMCCEHHLLPAFGHAHVGYIPNKAVVGLSKLARLVDAVGTSKPSMQEFICEQIADDIQGFVDPTGVMVVIEAEHSCMACRGVNAPGVSTFTSCVRGAFLVASAAREEFLALTTGKR